MQSLIAVLFGTSWKTSLAGWAAAALTAGVAYAQGQQGLVWYIIAAGFVIVSRFLPDASGVAPGMGTIWTLLLGSSPKTSFLGIAVALLGAAVTYAQSQTGLGWAAVAVGVGFVLRFVRDWGQPKPVAPAP
jgi:hypothetical protein